MDSEAFQTVQSPTGTTNGMRTSIQMSSWLAICLLNGLISACLAGRICAQSRNAALAGIVVDSTGAGLTDAEATATHKATLARRQAHTSNDGSYVLSTLMPGRYVVIASARGFQFAEVRNPGPNVNDRLHLRLELRLVGMGQAVTVAKEAAARVNPSAAMSTVIDRRFVENFPMNGRSLQTLLELTPGVVVAPTVQEGGQFSLNGQRTSANHFAIDGASANAGAPNANAFSIGADASGQLPGLTTHGKTNGMVSVDALHEFRIETSGYAPEFGGSPGGQI